MSGAYLPASLRDLVRDRANGCCEYCQIPEGLSFAFHEVDHIIAEKHGGETISENLPLSCVLCNRRKGTDLASIDSETGEIIPLFHPRKQKWTEHFRFESSRIVPLTAVARATLRLLDLNHRSRIVERAHWLP